jgi:hypothetical protein
MRITTKKYKFNRKFIDILNHCTNRYSNIERLDIDSPYSIFTIINIIKQISKYNRGKYYYDVPIDLKTYFQIKNNISSVAYTIYIIKYFVNKEILVDKIDKKISDTYITISSIGDNYNIKHFIVHI